MDRNARIARRARIGLSSGIASDMSVSQFEHRVRQPDFLTSPNEEASILDEDQDQKDKSEHHHNRFHQRLDVAQKLPTLRALVLRLMVWVSCWPFITGISGHAQLSPESVAIPRDSSAHGACQDRHRECLWSKCSC
jgi:hypothetical protein